MFRKEWQVCLTYLTQRWLWFLGLVYAIFLFTGFTAALDANCAMHHNRHAFIFFPGASMLIGGFFIVSIAKWQFANPRGRLVPGYARPHLLILSLILLPALVLIPVFISTTAGVTPWGLLAYTLLLGGGYLWSVGASQGWLMFPVLAVCFSAYTEAGQDFWLSAQFPFLGLHVLLIILGTASVVGWIWRLVNLNEEMPDYQVTPLAGWSRPSHLESAEARKLIGRQATKAGIASRLSDLWHDRLPQMTVSSAQRQTLFRYGFQRLSPGVQAAWFAILLFIWVGVLTLTFEKGSFLGTPLVFTLAGPGLIVLLHLRQRQGRMPQELLMPLERNEFFAGLWRALAWEMLLTWFALHLSLSALVGFDVLKVPELTMRSAVGFAMISAAMLLPMFGVALRLARVRSAILLGIGGYAVVGAQFGWLSLWWKAPTSIGVLMLLFTIVLGVLLINWSQRQWLEVELG